MKYSKLAMFKLKTLCLFPQMLKKLLHIGDNVKLWGLHTLVFLRCSSWLAYPIRVQQTSWTNHCHHWLACWVFLSSLVDTYTYYFFVIQNVTYIWIWHSEQHKHSFIFCLFVFQTRPRPISHVVIILIHIWRFATWNFWNLNLNEWLWNATDVTILLKEAGPGVVK